VADTRKLRTFLNLYFRLSTGKDTASGGSLSVKDAVQLPGGNKYPPFSVSMAMDIVFMLTGSWLADCSS
jgi:hypothetical protein